MKQENNKKNKTYMDLITGRKNKYSTIVKFYKTNYEIQQAFDSVDDLIEAFYVEVVEE